MKSQHDENGTLIAVDPASKYAGAITIGAIIALVVIRVLMEKK